MPDFSKMTTEEFAAWQVAQSNPPGNNVGQIVATDAGLNYVPPMPAPVQSRPAAEVWGQTEYDFVCPSGAMCRMRKLMPEQLIEEGILDRIATLPGYVEEVVEKAEGLPPKNVADAMPSKEDLSAIRDILEVLVPMVVVEPRVYPVPTTEPRVAGRIYTDSIELMDRVAIMERAVQGVKKYEPFRP